MIDLSSEPLITLAEAARLRPLGRNGRATHVATIYRWISRGIRGIRLEALRVGGALFTSREAVQRFAEALTTSGATTSRDRERGGGPVTSQARRHQLNQVDQQLQRERI